MHSLNPAYESYEIQAEEIKEIWQFRHYISHELPEPEIPNSQIIQRITQLQKEIARLKGNE